jgi:cell division transport system permease protein
MTKKYRVNKAMFFNAKITSIVSITLVLVLLGLTILTLFLGNRLSDYVKENVSFSVILEHNVTDAQIAETRKRLDDMPFVKSSRFIGKEEAKELLIQDLGEDPEELLGFNPAPDCIEIFLKSEYANTDSLAKVSEIIKAETNIDDLLYQQEVIELINNNLSKITAILLILSVVLLFISFTLISNTIRLSIYAKRFLIHTMNLVGAVDAFPVGHDGVECFGMNIESQLRRKPNGAHHAQRIVAKRDIGVQRRSDNAVFQILQAIEIIYQFAKSRTIDAQSQRIDRKIAPFEIVLQRTVFHNGFSGIVGIRFFSCSHKFQFIPFVFYLCRAKILINRHFRLFAHFFCHCLRQCYAASHNHKIDIFRRSAKKNIANVSSYHITLHIHFVGNLRNKPENRFI